MRALYARIAENKLSQDIVRDDEKEKLIAVIIEWDKAHAQPLVKISDNEPIYDLISRIMEWRDKLK